MSLISSRFPWHASAENRIPSSRSPSCCALDTLIDFVFTQAGSPALFPQQTMFTACCFLQGLTVTKGIFKLTAIGCNGNRFWLTCCCYLKSRKVAAEKSPLPPLKHPWRGRPEKHTSITATVVVASDPGKTHWLGLLAHPSLFLIFNSRVYF